MQVQRRPFVVTTFKAMDYSFGFWSESDFGNFGKGTSIVAEWCKFQLCSTFQ